MKRFVLLASVLALMAPGVARGEGCLSGACHTEIASLKNRHQPEAGGGCLSCHLQKVPEHPVTKAKSFELRASGKDLCAKCHDGIGKKKFQHPPVKDGECTSCHNPHGAKGKMLLPVEGDYRPLCFNCHDQDKFKRKFVHGPVAEGACLVCHDPHESDAKRLLRGEVKALCLKCHEDFAKGMAAGQRVHDPVKKTPCTSCHDPHSSDHGSLLKQKMPDLCIGCHKKIGAKIAGAKVAHKAVTDTRGCGNCHSTHFSAAKGLLAGEQKTICLGCHGGKAAAGLHLRDIAAEIGGNKTLHGPLKNGRCDGCHDPHGSDHRGILTGKYPATFYAPYTQGSYGLCLQCHDRNLLSFDRTTLYTKFRNGDLNLHFIHVADRVKGRSCFACHATHAAAGEKLMNPDGVRFGAWQIKTRLKLTSTGGSCAPGCHSPYSYDRNTPAKFEVKTPGVIPGK